MSVCGGGLGPDWYAAAQCLEQEENHQEALSALLRGLYLLSAHLDLEEKEDHREAWSTMLSVVCRLRLELGGPSQSDRRTCRLVLVVRRPPTTCLFPRDFSGKIPIE